MRALAFAALLLAGCAGNLATDPAVANLQRWTATCGTFLAMQTVVNNQLAAGRITPESSAAQSFSRVDVSLRPVCGDDDPPTGLDTQAMASMLDAQFVEMQRLKGELK